ncbi:phage holin family protein [Sorangium sp. So ce131]|uniref:phage holin family protein n=1 Tax=Sorangium sp. So ce131 TaxID=3133282 RepID=UPI003F624380
MRQVDPRPESSTADLVKEAIAEAKELMQVEVALARDEISEEIAWAKRSGIALGVAVAAALIGLALVLVALALSISPSPIPALLLGLGFVVLAVVVGLVGYTRAPKRPLERTQERVAADVRVLREHVA